MKLNLIKLSIVCMVVSLILPIATATYDEEKTEIINFLKEDKTNIKYNWTKVSSGIYAYDVARNASFKNISLGRVFVHNSYLEPVVKSYVFNYHITDSGRVIFIDPQTDKIVNYTQMQDRYHGKPVISYTSYYHYYPDISIGGTGVLNWYK